MKIVFVKPQAEVLIDPDSHENARYWQNKYADFVRAYNKSVEQEGLPLEQWKSF